jgi:hypothetical protein
MIKYFSLMISMALICSFAKAADFTIQVSPANNSVSDAQVNSISSSKITGLGTFALKSSVDYNSTDIINKPILGTLAAKSSLVAADIPVITSTQVSGLGTLSSKSVITNSEITDNSINIAKIIGFASAVATEVSNSIASSMSNYLLKTDIKVPQITTYKNGSGTYTVPSKAKYLKIRMVGAGGGGAGSTANTGNNVPLGANGTSSSFGSSLLIAGGGFGAGNGTASYNSGSGGTNTISAGPQILLAIDGQTGGVGVAAGGGGYYSTGFGGGTPFGPGAQSAQLLNDASTPTAPGGGGGGGGTGNSGGNYGGAGGGSGAYIEAMIFSPTEGATYSYSVGVGGIGGLNGGGGRNGGPGAPGLVEVTAYFQ